MAVAAGGALAAENGGEGTSAASRIRLPLEKVVRSAVRRNGSVIAEYLQTKISEETVRAEKSIYEPLFQTSLISQSSAVQNSTDDLLVRQTTNYEEMSNQFDLGVSGVVPTGAQWDLKLVNNQKNSSSIDRYRSYKYEYGGNVKLSVTQPLLKGFGARATEARINLATIQGTIDSGKFEQRVMELLGTTVQVYWRLYGAQKVYETWLSSLQIAEQSTADIELRFNAGKLPESDLLEARSGLLQRKSELSAARSRLFEARSQLYTLLNSPCPPGDAFQLFELDEPDTAAISLQPVAYYLDAALARWPEYQNAKRQVEKERMQLEFTSNQALPQFDLVGSVGTNSMGSSFEDAYLRLGEETFLGWSVGLKFSMPLMGGAARSALSIARVRLQQAEVERDSLERNLANSIHIKLDTARSLQEQLRQIRDALDIRGRLLAIEREKLKAGKVGQKSLLNQEEEFVNFQRRYLAGIVGLTTAVASLEISSSDILSRFGIDPASYVPQVSAARGSVWVPE